MHPALKKISRPLIAATGNALAAVFDNHARLPGEGVFELTPDMTGRRYLGFMRGNYEKPEREILQRYFRPASQIVEIGANIGVVSNAAATNCLTAQGRIICVEPNAHVIPVLKRNLERTQDQPGNELKQIIVLEAALAAPSHPEYGEFLARPNLSSGLTTHVSPQAYDTAPLRVPLISLGELLFEHGMGQERFSLICDAEGAEISMILGERDVLRRCDQLAIELHQPDLTGSDFTPADMLEELADQGFTLGGQIAGTYYLSRQPV